MKTILQRLVLFGALAGTGVILANCRSDSTDSVMDNEEAQTTNSQTEKMPSGADQTRNAPTTTNDTLGTHEEDTSGTGGGGKAGTKHHKDAGTSMDAGETGGAMGGAEEMDGGMGMDAGTKMGKKHHKK